MKNYKKLASILVSCQLLMALTACETNNGETSNPEDMADTSVTDTKEPTSDSIEDMFADLTDVFDLMELEDVILATSGLSADTVVAYMGEKEITAQEMFYCVLSELDYYDMMAMYGMGYIPWGETMNGEAFEDSAIKSAVELAFIYQTIKETALEEGLEFSSEAKSNIEGYINSVREELGGVEEVFEYVLWQSAVTEDFYMYTSEVTYLYDLLRNKYFGEEGSRLPALSEVADILEAGGSYRVKHILISTVDDYNVAYDDAQKATALQQAEGILAKLEASNDLENYFHEMMLANSEDPGSLTQPDGYTSYSGQMVPEFEEASYQLAHGEMSGIVESQFGYHIILRLPLEVTEEDIATASSQLEVEMQDQWVAEVEMEFTDAYEKIDLQEFYENLSQLRSQTDPYVATIGGAVSAESYAESAVAAAEFAQAGAESWEEEGADEEIINAAYEFAKVAQEAADDALEVAALAREAAESVIGLTVQEAVLKANIAADAEADAIDYATAATMAAQSVEAGTVPSSDAE